MVKTSLCPYCSSKNVPGAAYCVSCGRKVLPCPECGSLNSTALMFCAECNGTLPRWEEPLAVDPDAEEEPYFEYEWFGHTHSYSKFGYWGRMSLALVLSVFAALAIMATDQSETGICFVFMILGSVGLSLFILLIYRRRVGGAS